MTLLSNKHYEVIKILKLLPVEESNDLIAKATKKCMTPELEDAVTNLRSIPGIGPVAARSLLLALGIVV